MNDKFEDFLDQSDLINKSIAQIGSDLNALD